MHTPISFEVYPPRNPNDAPALYKAIDELGKLSPDFISVTFGAAGSETKNSLEVLQYIKQNTSASPLAHLTCAGTSALAVQAVVDQFLSAGVTDFLALRGDLPLGVELLPVASLKSAAELVEIVAGRTSGKIAVAAFPNGHPESGENRGDIAALLAKQAAGAHFAITQLFFYAQDYLNFLELTKAAGVTMPILPGIMPITSHSRLRRVLELTGEREPIDFANQLEAAGDSASRKEIGISWAAGLIGELVEHGVPGIHLYAFNEHLNVTEVLRRARVIS